MKKTFSVTLDIQNNSCTCSFQIIASNSYGFTTCSCHRNSFCDRGVHSYCVPSNYVSCVSFQRLFSNSRFLFVIMCMDYYILNFLFIHYNNKKETIPSVKIDILTEYIYYLGGIYRFII